MSDTRNGAERRLAEASERYRRAVLDLRQAELESIKETVRRFSPELAFLDFSEIGSIPVPPLTINRIRISPAGTLEASAELPENIGIAWLPETALTIRETDAIHSVLKCIIDDPAVGYTSFQGILRRT